jgi:hypothetical protein
VKSAYSRRGALLGIAILMSLIGIWIVMNRNIRVPSTIARVNPYQLELGDAPLSVQHEPPSEEVSLDGGDIIAEVPDESGWVESGNPDSIPQLIRYLKSQNEVVQRAALAEFAGMGAKAKKAVPAVVDALQDPRSSIRVKAAVTLIHMDVQAKVAVRALAKELRSEDAEARALAASEIDELVNPPPEILGTHCWGPEPPPRIARPWVKKLIQQAME